MQAPAVPFCRSPDNTPAHATALVLALVLSLGMACSAAGASPMEIYRCPGNPAVYTSDLRLVRANRCTRLGATPVAAALPQATPAPAGSAFRPVVAAQSPGISPRISPGTATITRAQQQQRDSDRVQILQAELTRERERLVKLTQQLRASQSASQSASPDPDSAKPAETLALSEAIQRSETDLQALERELSRAQR
jgi:hypothetical protein